jgi:four helix bundle protein
LQTANSGQRLTSEQYAERLLDYAATVVRLIRRFSGSATGRYIGQQLMRASASAGANYNEARAAESRADFIHKLQIALKELRESVYWLRLVERSGLAPASATEPLLEEAGQLVRMTAKSVVTAKRSARSV